MEILVGHIHGTGIKADDNNICIYLPYLSIQLLSLVIINYGFGAPLLRIRIERVERPPTLAIELQYVRVEFPGREQLMNISFLPLIRRYSSLTTTLAYE